MIKTVSGEFFMEQNLESVTEEIVEASTPVESLPPEKPKKSKGLLCATILFAILALAGIGFGVYGMFFNKSPECITNCGTNDITITDDTDTAPSVSEVQKILEDKYGFVEIQNVFADGIFRKLDNFDQESKISFVLGE